MQSHVDRDAERALPSEFWPRLKGRAGRAMAGDLSGIAGGLPDELPLAEWRYKTLSIVERPEDEQKILRISVGGGVPGADISYCVFRGDRTQCAYLLETAAAALRAGPMSDPE